MKLVIAGIALGLLLLTALWIYPFFTMGPSDERLETFRGSEQFNTQVMRFRNPLPRTPVEDADSGFEIMLDMLFPPDNREPSQKMPDQALDQVALAEKSEQIRFAWLGHSTIFLEMAGQRILFDPVFSDNASPIPFTVGRFQAPAWPLEAIYQTVDLVVISHNHYDHLDEGSIRKLAAGNAQFLVPLGVGSYMTDWGLDQSRIVELDWWESHESAELKLTAGPAQHFSGRGFNDGDKSLWASWSVLGEVGKVFISGDTGYSPHFGEIGERLGPFDLTFLENGAYSKNWPYVHQLPEEAVQAHLDLKGKVMIPVHWGMFALGPHPWDEPARRVSAEADKRGIDLISPQIGQLLTLEQALPRERWWELMTTGQ